jgi:hypothetical protein
MPIMSSSKGQRLQNVCRWSSSREATFNECRKKYWYSYYGSWEGWPKNSFDTRTSVDPLAAYLYMLKNMQPACMFLGSCVHKIIEETLKSCSETRRTPSAEQLMTKASAYLDRALDESKSQQWKTHPKHHCNLLEHYYGRPFGKEEEDSMRSKIHSCLTNWLASPCIEKIALDPRSKWLGIESNQTFPIEGGIEAIVVYDFFLHWTKADGTKMMLIFDWKTGQESQKIEAQLSAYALAATILFSAPLDSLIISPFYLLNGPKGYRKYGVGQEIPISQEQLSENKTRIIDSARAMLALHPSEAAPSDPCLFPYTEDRRGCRRCPYQQLCMAADFQPKAQAELREMASSLSQPH